MNLITDPPTPDEKELAAEILNGGLVRHAFLLARLVLRVEGLERTRVVRRTRPELELPTDAEDERAIDDLCAKRAAGLKTTPMAQPQRFTAPEALPVGAKVRILDIGQDGNPQHKVGDVVTVVNRRLGGRVMVRGEIGFAHGDCDLSGMVAYLAGAGADGGTWVRTVELVEPAQPVESEPSGNPLKHTPMGDCGWQSCHELDRLRSELTRLTEENARLRRDLGQIKHEHEDACAELRLVREVCRHIPQPAEAKNPAHEMVLELRSELDAANSRAERMAASLMQYPTGLGPLVRQIARERIDAGEGAFEAIEHALAALTSVGERKETA